MPPPYNGVIYHIDKSYFDYRSNEPGGFYSHGVYHRRTVS